MKLLRTQGLGALKTKEGAELFYSVILGSALGLGVHGYYQKLKEDRDRNFAEEIIFKSTRDALSLIGALSPKFIGSFAAPRLASFIIDIGEAVNNLIMWEKYKSGKLKGVEQLKRTFTPSVVTSIVGKKEKPQIGNAGKLPSLPALPKLPKYKI